jgi:hypothetical protein
MTPGRPSFSIWVKIGAIVFVAALCFLFFQMTSARQRHKLHDEVPLGGPAPGKPVPALSH